MRRPLLASSGSPARSRGTVTDFLSAIFDAAGEPKWRFRFNDLIRDALYKVGELEDKKSELTVEKQCVPSLYLVELLTCVS